MLGWHTGGSLRRWAEEEATVWRRGIFNRTSVGLWSQKHGGLRGTWLSSWAERKERQPRNLAQAADCKKECVLGNWRERGSGTLNRSQLRQHGEFLSLKRELNARWNLVTKSRDRHWATLALTPADCSSAKLYRQSLLSAPVYNNALIDSCAWLSLWLHTTNNRSVTFLQIRRVHWLSLIISHYRLCTILPLCLPFQPGELSPADST